MKQRMRFARVTVALAVCTVSVLAYAQSLRDDIVYRQEARDLHTRVRALMQRGFHAETKAEKLAVDEQQLQLVRRVHALSEDAERADLEMQKSGGPTDKDLLLVDQAGLMMDATLSAVSKYMYTGDNLFLVVAKDLDAQTHRVTAALR